MRKTHLRKLKKLRNQRFKSKRINIKCYMCGIAGPSVRRSRWNNEFFAKTMHARDGEVADCSKAYWGGQAKRHGWKGLAFIQEGRVVRKAHCPKCSVRGEIYGEETKIL